MKIWVDADACPNAIKEIIFRAARRTNCQLTLVANYPVQVPTDVQMLVVPPGFDGADNKIVELLESGDLVISADIPLAAKVLEKGGYVFTPRGEEYTARNIGDRLSVRNFLESFRGGAEPIGGGPPPLNNKDKANFANRLDRFLAKHHQ
ncbi:YaiI/YqxD family protein [Synechococcus sp. PCC 7335]|uniref:YaiI/YqxD family protein n=1 Tax=Synechococcus sp. (strain ATCC 29403 / PCC 7335) TaxID=91464 RepID=UPI00017ED5ED|nr:YaiI/YqxD family protein [Synechococcus sp. PCC 7335]EDX85585.1 YaiI/YqxD family protein [Synechococcus sp. PCC 7335]